MSENGGKNKKTNCHVEMDSDESLEIGVPYSQTNSFQENLSKDMNRNLLMSSTKTNQPYWYVSD
jgi:hypothetical protein